MATKTGVRLSGRFSPGQQVDLYERFGDQFDVAHVGAPLQTAKVSRAGLVEFSGLEEGKRYWIAGEDDDVVRGVAMTAKAWTADASPLSEDEIAARLAQTRPPASAARTSSPVTGARSSTTTRVLSGAGQPFANAQVGKPTPKGEQDPQPAPYARIEDVKKGVPLRSHTVTGEAHVVNPDLPDGKLRQDQVPDRTPQASDTPLGEATVIGDEDQATARLENKVPASPAEPSETDQLPKKELSEEAVQERQSTQAEPKTAGIEAAQAGKVPAEAKRSAAGKTPEAPKRVRSGKASGKAASTRTGARKASPKRK
jgi:hypothetical protein